MVEEFSVQNALCRINEYLLGGCCRRVAHVQEVRWIRHWSGNAAVSSYDIIVVHPCTYQSLSAVLFGVDGGLDVEFGHGHAFSLDIQH
jgi:hypothetical protein